MHFRNATIQQVYNQSKAKWTQIIEQKTVLPTPYIRLFKEGLYDGRRHFPSCTDEPEAVSQHTRPENFMDTSVASTSPLIFGTPIQMGTMNDLTNILAHVTQNTPQYSAQISHQLAPTKLLSRLVHDEDDGSCQQERTTHDAMIDCDIQEPEDDDINTCKNVQIKGSFTNQQSYWTTADSKGLRCTPNRS